MWLRKKTPCMRRLLSFLWLFVLLVVASVSVHAQDSYPGSSDGPYNATSSQSSASEGPSLRWNVYSKRYEWAPTNGVLLYNSYEHVYQFASPNASLLYNAYTKKYEYAPPGSELKFNSYENTWQFAPPNAYLRQNPYTKRWQWVY